MDSREQEILELEQKFWTAMQNSDGEAAVALTDDPCIITGAQGVAKIDHTMFSAMMQGSSWTLNSFEITDPIVYFASDDMAIIAYKVREDLIVEGKLLTLKAADSSTWLRKNGRWFCSLHTEAVLGDPYGRDHIANIP